jgi:dephospho-CoA kinase
VVAGKPIIGLAGGIGSGKSFVARAFAELGCHVIDSDSQVRAAYDQPQVRETLQDWWGSSAFTSDGNINRPWIAQKVFTDPAQKARLEGLIHPIVTAARDQEMKEVAPQPSVLAFVWDTPLLFEAGLDRECDVVVFVQTPDALRYSRVGQSRGWGADEWIRRENSQWGLDKKRELSDYIVKNAADAAQVRDQVRELLPRILALTAQKSASGKDPFARRRNGGNT